ncbi:aminomethyl-transferring glycine dehydrogenase [Kytococcus sp. Marseille-QA3725]
MVPDGTTPTPAHEATEAPVFDASDELAPHHEPDFVRRHIGPRAEDVEHMLGVVGQPSMDAMISAAVPGGIQGDEQLTMTAAPTEQAATAEMRAYAERNTVARSMIGLGYYGTHTPPVILRKILENPAWYTAYTPYQPEISQGRLEALLNFQTMCAELTGLTTAGASLLDEGTAVAEAMTVMRRTAKVGAKDNSAVLLLDSGLMPQSIALTQTRAKPLGIPVVVADLTGVDSVDALRAAAGDRDVFGVIVQYPAVDGAVRDWATLTEVAHEAGALVTAAADLLALTLLTPPGEWGADVAVGTTQRFGVPMGFGGPHAGYMAVREGLERTLPGRLVGVSKDAEGQVAYRLALQTREQHIRREKATSNICTAQVLLAVIASMYAVWHGPQGLRSIARDVHGKTRRLAGSLTGAGLEVLHRDFFDTLAVRVPGKAGSIVAAARREGVLLWKQDEDTVLVSVDETTLDTDLQVVAEAFGVSLADRLGPALDLTWPENLQRTSDFLTPEVFHLYRSETQMLRYLRELSERDYALDRGMIPLGSCTMKLNATTAMEPITWPEFAELHPFAPAEHSEGIRALMDELAQWLCDITGYAAVSLQPNSGAQGELAGLMAIRAYHASKGQEHRDVCLIPASAHGTNAASAVMAGMKVVVVKTAPGGDIDMEDLRAKIDEHGQKLAAIMVTYPSTHGVFEETISDLCAMVHDAGGQVYVDGANLNALIGVARPGRFGSDVSHLNLHKTFTIPHGGGGPGVGPIGVREHLAPFLPNHPLVEQAGPATGVGPIAAAPWGSASIMPIPWAYIRMMGSAGLRRATRVAVLSANYLAKRLDEHYPVLYTGQDGLVAHECILDLRQITKDTGVTVDDVAKRLIDYGFHAPTMSFPVAGTLMVEPTESESLAELDRFVDAMVAIKAEIDQVGQQQDADDSVLRHAPYTARSMAGEWPYSFTRAEAVYPAGVNPATKYFPPVRRIDGVYGDRNLMCSCPPAEAFED